MSLLEELKGYCYEMIESNQACVKHKWACKRFLRDLERIGNKDFPYIFDEEKANKFLDWMQIFDHTKGPLAGTPKIPDPIEKFNFGNIYGWVHKDTGIRRFRKFYWQVARKNAKSQDQAIVGLYEMSGFGEPSAEVYVAATKKDQTRYVWGEARVISSNCKLLEGKIITKFHDDLATKVIMHPKSNSFFARMSEEDKKKGDGSNPQCGILDEYHAHPTSEYYDILTSGMKTRKQPILMIITTAGFELNHPCYSEEYRYVSDILNPDNVVENDRYFVMVNELDMDEEGNLIDDINDETCWIKPNPIIAKTAEGIESIRDELKVALDKPEKMRDFLTKTMNVWVNQRASGYMNMAKWKLCCTKDMPDVRGLPVTVGFDLSAVIDLTSAGFEIPLPDGRIAAFSHSFMPKDNLKQKENTDNVPYALWAEQGWITLTEGSQVDYKFMVKYVVDFIAKMGLIEKEFCFDRYMATMLMQELTEEGHTVIEIPQGIPTLGIPTKDFRAQVYDAKIIAEDNPVLNWAMGNAVVRTDHNDNIMLDKGKAKHRIDPAASLLNAHVRVYVTPEVPTYAKRGMRIL